MNRDLATRPRDQIYKINAYISGIISKAIHILKNSFIIRGGLFIPLKAGFMSSPDFIGLGSNRCKWFCPDSSGPSPACRQAGTRLYQPLAGTEPYFIIRHAKLENIMNQKNAGKTVICLPFLRFSLYIINLNFQCFLSFLYP